MGAYYYCDTCKASYLLNHTCPVNMTDEELIAAMESETYLGDEPSNRISTEMLNRFKLKVGV